MHGLQTRLSRVAQQNHVVASGLPEATPRFWTRLRNIASAMRRQAWFRVAGIRRASR
jgi:hypothetical protein